MKHLKSYKFEIEGERCEVQLYDTGMDDGVVTYEIIVKTVSYSIKERESGSEMRETFNEAVSGVRQRIQSLHQKQERRKQATEQFMTMCRNLDDSDEP